MRIDFQQELDRLQTLLQDEGDLATRALRSAINALERQDLELADEVIAFDDRIDDAYLAIEYGVLTLLARQTPVAVDLRLVLAILHNNLHLERIGDLCVTIAKLTKLAHGLQPDPTLVEGFEEMSARAEDMIRTALDSFTRRDVLQAYLNRLAKI